MELIFNNQISIFEDIFYKYLTPKQYTKLYTSNLILYNIYLSNNKLESYYFTPKDTDELRIAVNKWCSNKEEAIIKYGYINNWNTINITNMSYVFYNKHNDNFNDNISDWNISNIYNMGYMFFNCYNFNQNISNWNTSNVKYMEGMFYNCFYFNQNINNWNISNVQFMNCMFYNAKNFNELNCIHWDLRHIEDKYKLDMFKE